MKNRLKLVALCALVSSPLYALSINNGTPYDFSVEINKVALKNSITPHNSQTYETETLKQVCNGLDNCNIEILLAKNTKPERAFTVTLNAQGDIKNVMVYPLINNLAVSWWGSTMSILEPITK